MPGVVVAESACEVARGAGGAAHLGHSGLPSELENQAWEEAG